MIPPDIREGTAEVGTPDTTVDLSTVLVEAPFVMPPIRVPTFVESPSLSMVDFGAREDDMQANDRAIKASIRTLMESGGGTVLIPPGTWSVGPVQLESGINLHLAEGATLRFSPDPADYLPAVKTSWEGMECLNYRPLIYAYGSERIAISGRGRLEADLSVWSTWYGRPAAHLNALAKLYMASAQNAPLQDRNMTHDDGNLRPPFIHFNRCRHILIEDVAIRHSPFWVIHPYLCEDVVIRRVRIVAHGHNNDGVDPEMSQNVLIEDCTFDQGDDAVSIKSGRNHEAWRLNTPSRNVVMRNCQIRSGHQLLALGSELSGGIENVWVQNCHFDPQESVRADPMMNILFIKTNERRGGFVRNVFLENITATTIEGSIVAIDTDVLYQWRDLVPTLEIRHTDISNLTIEAVRVGSARHRVRIDGDEARPVTAVSLVNVTSDHLLADDLILSNVERFTITPTKTIGAGGAI